MYVPNQLYHGTSTAHWKKIQREGLRPRARGSSGNWPSAPSGHGMVYLSDVYALKYAIDSANVSGQGLVLKINPFFVDLLHCWPDEDWYIHYLKQNGYERNGSVLTKKTELQYAREHLRLQTNHSELALWSLSEMGVLAFKGSIPPEAIQAAVKIKEPAKIVLSGYDPSPSPVGYNVLAKRYKAWMGWLFGEEPKVEDYFGDAVTFTDRDAVEIIYER